VPHHRLKFFRFPDSFAVCRLAPNAIIPAWATNSHFFSITRTSEELSIVCVESHVPPDVHHEGEWVCLVLKGPFPFSETGILASFLQPLSDNAIPIFAVSTFNTDYVLVKQAWIDKAIAVLIQAGHEAL
jgi:uncharacterized protein